MTLNEALRQAESYDQGALALLKTLITTVETCISEATQGPLGTAKPLRALAQFGEGMDARGVLLYEPHQRPNGESLANLSTSGTTRALVQRHGGRVESVVVNHRPRERGTSKYGLHNRLWVGIVDLFGVMWLIRRARRPVLLDS